MDPNSTTLATDADCDGVLTADDCDDVDPASTVLATDADCDGVLTAFDCDDTDPNVTTASGATADCAVASCLDALNNGHSTGDGVYWLTANGAAYQAYCDMSSYGGGWTLSLKATGTTLRYDSPYWTDSNLLNETSLDESNQNAKFQSFLSIPANEIMLKSQFGNSTQLGLPNQTTLTDLFNGSTTLLDYLDGSQTPSELINNKSFSHCSHTWRVNTHSNSNQAFIRLGGCVNYFWDCGYGTTTLANRRELIWAWVVGQPVEPLPTTPNLLAFVMHR